MVSHLIPFNSTLICSTTLRSRIFSSFWDMSRLRSSMTPDTGLPETLRKLSSESKVSFLSGEIKLICPDAAALLAPGSPLTVTLVVVVAAVCRCFLRAWFEGEEDCWIDPAGKGAAGDSNISGGDEVPSLPCCEKVLLLLLPGQRGKKRSWENLAILSLATRKGRL